jgi:hypothetical protein
MNHLLDNNRLYAVVAGGVFFVIAALLMQRVHDASAPVPLTRLSTVTVKV